eukprot:UN25860
MRKVKVIELKSNYQSQFPIGHSLSSSCTAVPNVWVSGDVAYVDCPGFNDTNGIKNELANCMGIKEIFAVCRSVRILYAIDTAEITKTSGRGSAVREAITTLAQMFNEPFHRHFGEYCYFSHESQ